MRIVRNLTIGLLAALTTSNYSSLLSIWDRVHRRLRFGVAPQSITIGVEGFEKRESVTLERSLLLPLSAPPGT